TISRGPTTTITVRVRDPQVDISHDLLHLFSLIPFSSSGFLLVLLFRVLVDCREILQNGWDQDSLAANMCIVWIPLLRESNVNLCATCASLLKGYPAISTMENVDGLCPGDLCLNLHPRSHFWGSNVH
ncbi:hypothetical protein BDM02DRAFT_3109982, partial [Thelephora ganbajun]